MASHVPKAVAVHRLSVLACANMGAASVCDKIDWCTEVHRIIEPPTTTERLVNRVIDDDHVQGIKGYFDL